MSIENYANLILTDLDFTYVYGPVAWATIGALLLDKRFDPQNYDRIQLHHPSHKKQILANAFAWTHHKVLRPEKKKAVDMLQVLKTEFDTADDPMGFGVLSGRTPETHTMTRKMLDPRIGKLFSPDCIYLNPGFKSSEFKTKTIIELIRQGLHVIMIEDDFKAGWVLTNHSEIPRHMLDVYLIRNLSTHRFLRYHGSYDDNHVPLNLHIMPSYKAIGDDILLHYLP